MRLNRGYFILFTSLFIWSSGFCQSGDFSTKGKVVAAGGAAIPNATITYVSIGKRLSWDFSDANGNFGPIGTGAIVPGASRSLTLPLSGKAVVEVFDLAGKKVCTAFRGELEKGAYSFNPDLFSGRSPGRSVYLVKVTTANGTFYQKIAYTGSGSNQEIGSKSGSASRPMKKLAAIDTIRVGKTGFTPVKIAIDSYTADVGSVTLAAINIEAQVTTLYGTLSQDEKVGQLVQTDCPGPSYVTSALLGSIFGGGNDGPGNGAGQPSEWAAFSTGYMAATANTAKKIPLFIGLDVVHGFGKCNGATVMPHNIGLGCTFSPAIVQKCHRVAGIESRGVGINLVFGPCIAVPRDDRWGRVYEGFSESPDLTAVMGRAAILGFQYSDLSNPLAVAACVKHFAGDGGTANGVDRGNATGDDAALRAIHLPGYTSVVQAGTASIMASFSSWNGIRGHENKALLTDWLKTGQGFDGFINGDWDGHTTGTTSAANCIIAGLDVPMRGAGSSAIGELQGLFNGLYGTNSDRVNDAVKRVLRIKYRMGLFTAPLTTNPALTATVGSAEHRAIAREAVRKSLVLLKTSSGALPISKTAKITICGQHGQDIGLQCGGWTLGWQGAAGNQMPGTTIKQGFEKIGGTANISYSADGNNITGDIAVVCIGEQPYAEWMGDKTDLAIPGASIITNAKNSGKKVICVMLTGRPMDISAIADKCDAIVAAWLPGTEGDGIAEVLYGNYNFTGKLSMSWPRNTAQEPVNVGDANYNPLYPYDFGLNFAGQQLTKGIYQ